MGGTQVLFTPNGLQKVIHSIGIDGKNRNAYHGIKQLHGPETTIFYGIRILPAGIIGPIPLGFNCE